MQARFQAATPQQQQCRVGFITTPQAAVSSPALLARRPCWQQRRQRQPPSSCRGLKENVAQLASVDDVHAVRVTCPAANIDHTIPNAPGKKASVAIFQHLAAKHSGRISADAAREGIELYGEYVAEAVAEPGSHPNIDLLLAALDQPGLVLTVEVEKQH